MNAPYRIGLVGLGAISRFYLAALDSTPEARLVALCDTDPAVLAPWRTRLRCHGDHRDLLAPHHGIDAVVVTVPNDRHAGICQDVLAAGLPVCVEKPLATTLSDGIALAETADSHGVPLFTAFHRRYNTAVTDLVRRIAGRPIESLTIRYWERIEEHVGADRWYLDPARAGGGCVADNGPNAYDLARLLLGELTVATVLVDRYGGVDRRALVRLRAGSGATARIDLDWSYSGERKDLTVRLTDCTELSADMLAGHHGFKASLWHEYEAVLRAFLAVCRGEAPTQPHAGLAALRLVDETYRAERAYPLATTAADET